MTEKEYELIAQSIWRSGYVEDKNKMRQSAREKMRKLIAIDLAYTLKAENPRFDPHRFLEVCRL